MKRQKFWINFDDILTVKDCPKCGEPMFPERDTFGNRFDYCIHCTTGDEYDRMLKGEGK
jgi:uncharacterized OB-fold protein